MLKQTRQYKLDSPPMTKRSLVLGAAAEHLRDVPDEAHVTVLICVWEEEKPG